MVPSAMSSLQYPNSHSTAVVLPLPSQCTNCCCTLVPWLQTTSQTTACFVLDAYFSHANDYVATQTESITGQMERRRRWSFSFGVKIFWVQSLASAAIVRRLMAITYTNCVFGHIWKHLIRKCWPKSKRHYLFSTYYLSLSHLHSCNHLQVLLACLNWILKMANNRRLTEGLPPQILPWQTFRFWLLFALLSLHLDW